VKLIVEKEREIKDFKPEESWKIFVELTYGKASFKAEFHKLSGKVKKLKSRADVEKIIATLYDTLDIIKE
jgi:DNA topoisomerase-1